MREAVEHDRSLAVQRGAALSFVAEVDSAVAEVDGPKIRQIIDGLVRNAIEAVTTSGHAGAARLLQLVPACEDKFAHGLR